MHFLKKMKQRAAAAMVVAVASVLTLGVGVANAAPAPGDMPTGQGSITIHKHKEVGNADALSPEGTSPAPSDPLKGVVFTVKKVDGLDLNNNGDWAKIKGLKLENGTVSDADGKTYTTGTSADVTTNEQGIATTGKLDMGVYLVEETGTGSNAITTKAAPFFVTIPLPFNGKWITDVHVYPKNVIQPPGTKEVTDDTDTHKVGDVLEWTITTTATTDNPKAFGVVDELKDYLDYVDNSATVKINGQATTDFDVTKETTPKKYVKITLKGDALTNLKKDANVTFTLKTKVTKMPDGGIVENSAWPIDNDYNPFDDPNVTTPPIVPTKDPYFGDYKFKKVDAGDPAKALSNAEFGLFQCDGDQAATTGVAIMTATSGDDGLVAFEGVYLGTFNKGTLATDAKKTFCLKETKAPAGYVLSDKVTRVEIAAGKVATPTDQLTTVTNTQQPGPDLPLTGAAGTLLLTVVGIGLVGAGVALYAVNSRSRKQR